jgi:hypothetical protein
MSSSLDEKVEDSNTESRSVWRTMVEKYKDSTEGIDEEGIRSLIREDVLVAPATIGIYSLKTSSNQPLNPKGYAFKRQEDAQTYANNFLVPHKGNIIITTVVEKI